MKKITKIIIGSITIVIIIALPVLIVWNIVEFLRYLVKDHPFNFALLWLLIADFITVFWMKISAALEAKSEFEKASNRLKK